MSANLLSMATLGIVRDAQPNRLQERIIDGVHLRWASPVDVGFPWYGYYLFRRPHQKGGGICISSAFPLLDDLVDDQGYWHGGGDGLNYYHSVGRIHSSHRLRFVDLFPASGKVECDLDDRAHLRMELHPPMLAWRAVATIGFKREVRRRRCTTFNTAGLSALRNPARVEGDSTLTVFERDGSESSVINITGAGSLRGLDCRYETRIVLAYSASKVDLRLFVGANAARVEALNREGTVLDRALLRSSPRPYSVPLVGRDITAVRIFATQNETTLIELCYEIAASAAKLAEIRVSALMDEAVVDEQVMSGAPGSVVDVELRADAISAVHFHAAAAVLIDLCVEFVRPVGKWQFVPESPRPIALPVLHVSYPASGNAATDEAASRAAALGRIKYGPPGVWDADSADASVDAFRELHEQLLHMVSPGPGSALGMAGAVHAHVPSDPVDHPSPAVTMNALRLLEWMLFAALHPAFAEMLGSAFIDEEVAEGQVWDYLIVADHDGMFHASGSEALAYVNGSPDYDDVDGWICTGVEVKEHHSLEPPRDPRAYVLPGAAIRRSAEATDVFDAVGNVGLAWDRPLAAAATGASSLLPKSAVLYHVWRESDHVTSEEPPGSEPAEDAYKPVGDRPILYGQSTEPADPSNRPTDWPPVELITIDGPLPEAWYSYRISGIDIFGRHSPLSRAAEWWQWSPEPDPLPWYFDPGVGDARVHPFFVGILDKIPPPPPTGLRVVALDPNDPSVVPDDAARSWRASLPEAMRDIQVGLRISWRWTLPLARQAPDTVEFRVYTNPGRFNQYGGRVNEVSTAGVALSRVKTTIDVAMGANRLAGATLRVGSEVFQIEGNDSAAPLVLTVQNLGVASDIAPEPLRSCVVVVPLGHDDRVDHTRPSRWKHRAAVVRVGENLREGIETLRAGDAPAAGESATAAGSIVTLVDAGDLSVVRPGLDWLFLFDDTSDGLYLIMSVDTGASAVEVAGAPALPSGVSSWTIGKPFKEYEVFLPDPASPGEVIPSASLIDPISVVQVAVTAADGRMHTPDDPGRSGSSLGDRSGNESAIGQLGEGLRVWRKIPNAPVVPSDSERLFASRADYHGDSYFTYRWPKASELSAHVYRASLSALFEVYWFSAGRPKIDAGNEALFPDADDDPAWTDEKRSAVVDEINRLAAFPSSREGKASARSAVFNDLSNDALRIFAGLPELESAYQQRTPEPLHSNDPAAADRRGPDTATGYAPASGLNAYVDRLNGRARGWYFYRCAYVDAAQNISAKSLCSAPVGLIDVVPPKTPAIVLARAGHPDSSASQDRRITIEWRSNTETDFEKYLVYRTSDPNSARDVRLMDRVAEISRGLGLTEVWVDVDREAGVDWQYRILAVDESGNASPPSPVVTVRSFDLSVPEHPTWADPSVDGGAIRLSWTSPDASLRSLVQRRLEGAADWGTISGWLSAGSYVYADISRTAGEKYEYRLRVMDSRGRMNSSHDVLTV